MNAIITGATKGIGKAIALKLAQQGFNLAICARTESDLQTFKSELAHLKVKIIAIKADMGNKEEVYSFCNQVKSSFDKIDVLVNNAGVFIPGNMLDEEDKNFEYQNAVNVNAPYYLSKYFGKIMKDQQFGHIFNICSIASTEIIDNAGSYSVTKAAILSLNNVLRKELSAYNVKVTAILPGSTLTASWEGTNISPEKFVQPEDIANSLYSILNLSSGVNVEEIVLKPLNFNT
ncbi:SDR family oxidoreductase [Pedobacter boryungensis]|uniref:SDR family oxidoreductase n=1 Tax=Pedobacter boryungensis TaxID=869962 RepID=A0ABX2DAT1_9SPHI|nr:SDR family oxidoreductase [Pedobacter boryungensis]NQX30116.1 SDR family oxidoreductase [Pedobacter boryungensis]